MVVSWGLKGRPEFRSRCLLCRSSEAHLEAPLGQSVEGCAAQPTVTEEGDHGAPPVTEGGLALQQWREGGAQNHPLIDQMTDLQAVGLSEGVAPISANQNFPGFFSFC